MSFLSDRRELALMSHCYHRGTQAAILGISGLSHDSVAAVIGFHENTLQRDARPNAGALVLDG